MNKFLVALSFLTIMASCDDKLEVDPTQSIDQAQALSTEKDVLVTLIGAYDGIQEEEVYGGDYMVMSELFGNDDDIFFTGTFEGLSDIWNKAAVPTNENARATWIDSYSAINITR
jgi:hypothetical protein